VLLDNLMRLQTELHRYDPDLIVFYQAHNDLIAALHQVHEVERGRRQPYRIEPLSPWSDWLTRHSILYPKLLTRGRVWQQRAMLAERRSVNRPEIYTQSIERGVARHERDLRSFLAVAQTFEIPTVIPEVTFAGAGFEIELGSSLDRLWEGAVGLPTEHIMSGYRQYEAVTERVAAEFDVPYFQTVSAGTGAADSYAPDDPIHFNDVGAERMAEVVGRWLFGADLIR
jgi:hypothetical protein